MSKVKAGYIYPARKGREKVPRYEYYLCCMTGDYDLVDCIPVNKRGVPAPGFETGVPTPTSNFYVSRGVKAE